MKRAAIFGSRGQLGVELATVFSKRSYDVACYDRASVDISDAAAVEKVVVGFRPDLVLNPAAFNQVDLAESQAEAAFQVNALAVRNIAIAARNVGAQLVHYSTDYVFDGMAGRPYVEEDATHPLGAYAVSKLAGELYAQAYIEAPLVIRTCGVFGPEGVHTARGNFIEMMIKLASGDKPVRVVEDFVVSPTYAPALAERSADLIERGITGVLHIGGGVPISWYDWAKMIFAAAGLSPNLQATNSREFPTAARRPKFSALSNSKMESLGIAPMPPLEDALKDYFLRREPLAMRETV
jgi:dTDP-4-dehydrorhamnose reductase